MDLYICVEPRDVRLAVNTMLEPMYECLATRDRTETRGFGGFSLYDGAPWLGRNLKTDHEVSLENQIAPHFKSWKALMDPVNEDEEGTVIASRVERSNERISESRKVCLFVVKVMRDKGIKQFSSEFAGIVNQDSNIFLVVVELSRSAGDYVVGPATSVSVRKNIKTVCRSDEPKKYMALEYAGFSN